MNGKNEIKDKATTSDIQYNTINNSNFETEF